MSTRKLCFNKILVATDFYHENSFALKQAKALMTPVNGSVLLAHVVERDGEEEGSQSSEGEPDSEVREAEGQLKPAVDKAMQLGMEAQAKVLKGDVVTELLHAAEDFDADAILVATDGRTAVDRLIVGSVYNELLRASPYPVLTVTPHIRHMLAERGMDAPQTPKTIVCTCEPTDFSEQAIPFAAGLCRCFGATLALIYVHHADRHTTETPEEERQRIHDELNRRASEEDVVHRIKILDGSTVDSLIQAIFDERADLVVAATHGGRSSVRQIFKNGFVESLVPSSPCSILSIRPELARELPRIRDFFGKESVPAS